MIEGVFFPMVHDRAKVWRNADANPQCQILVLVRINALGQALGPTLVHPCEADKELNQGALRAFNQGFPPPPKDLLVDGELELAWTFRIAPRP